MNRLALAIPALIIAGLVGEIVVMEHSHMRPATIVGCAHEYVAEAPELADIIEHEIHVRPMVIAFTGSDTIDIVFCDPRLWDDNHGSKEVRALSLWPLPSIARHIARFAWGVSAREGGINVMNIDFIRLRRSARFVFLKQVPAQQVTLQFTRATFDANKLQVPMVVIQREGGEVGKPPITIPEQPWPSDSGPR